MFKLSIDFLILPFILPPARRKCFNLTEYYDIITTYYKEDGCMDNDVLIPYITQNATRAAENNIP